MKTLSTEGVPHTSQFLGRARGGGIVMRGKEISNTRYIRYQGIVYVLDVEDRDFIQIERDGITLFRKDDMAVMLQPLKN